MTHDCNLKSWALSAWLSHRILACLQLGRCPWALNALKKTYKFLPWKATTTQRSQLIPKKVQAAARYNISTRLTWIRNPSEISKCQGAVWTPGLDGTTWFWLPPSFPTLHRFNLHAAAIRSCRWTPIRGASFPFLHRHDCVKAACASWHDNSSRFIARVYTGYHPSPSIRCCPPSSIFYNSVDRAAVHYLLGAI